MLARLQPNELRAQLTSLYGAQDTAERNFNWWRDDTLELAARMQSLVEFYYDDTLVNDQLTPNFDRYTRARFNFEELANDISIQNGFYWAADTHGDWVRTMAELNESARRVDELVTRELEYRR